MVFKNEGILHGICINWQDWLGSWSNWQIHLKIAFNWTHSKHYIQHIWIISEGSWDTEDWSNDAENLALHHRNKWHFKIYSNRKQLFEIVIIFHKYYSFLWWPSSAQNKEISTTQQNRHNTTQHNTTQHNTTQHNTTKSPQHNKITTTQHNTTQHNTTQHNTTKSPQHNTTQHNTTQHNTTQQNHHNTTKSPQHNKITTTQHNTTQHNTTKSPQHNTTQHNTTQHNTTQHNGLLLVSACYLNVVLISLCCSLFPCVMEISLCSALLGHRSFYCVFDQINRL